MKVLVFAAVTLAIFGACFGESISENCPDDQKHLFKDGCLRFTCKDGSVSGVGCGLIAPIPVDSKCYMTEDTKLVFPECCPKVVCEGDEGFDEKLLTRK